MYIKKFPMKPIIQKYWKNFSNTFEKTLKYKLRDMQ